jgi:hypothetical protein
MHHVGIVITSEYVSGASHVGSQLIDLVDAAHYISDNARIPQVTNDKLVSWDFAEFVEFEIDCPNPITLLLQPLH